MNPEELRRQIAARMTESRAVIEQAKTEGRATLTSAETARFQALQTEIGEAKATLEILETQQRNEAHFAEPARPPVATLPERGITLQAHGFASFGDYLQTVAHASMPGYHVDQRLRNIEAAVSGASESIPSDGGYLVGTDMASQLLQSTHDTGQLVGRVRHIPISANSNSLKFYGVDETSRANGSRWGGVQVFWDGEGDPFTGTRPKFRQVELNLKKMTGLFYSTDELLQDAAALEAVGRQAFSEEFGFKLDDAILNGSGAGMPVGIIGHPSTVVVPKRTGQAAATVVTQNIIDMWSGLYPRGRTNAVWLVNPDVEPELELLTVPIGTAGELWDGYQQPQPGVNGHPYATLKGRAVIPVEQCAALGTVGDICLVDLSQYVMIDKGGIQSASSIHVRFVYDEMTFRWVLRTDGQPTWRTTLTPYKGSSIVGPFVTLETRS